MTRQQLSGRRDLVVTWSLGVLGTVLAAVTAAGRAVGPTVLPLLLVAAASWAVVLVLRRPGRRVACVLGAAVSLGAVALVLTAPSGAAADLVATTLVALGGSLSAGAFLAGWWRAPRWPEMSSRYDARPAAGGLGQPPTPGAGGATGASAQQEDPSPEAVWRALDEGRDPTV